MKNKLALIAILPISIIIFHVDKSIDKSYVLMDAIQSELKSMYSEWYKCKNKEVPFGFQIIWKIKLKSISSIGGLYGEGHIYGDKAYAIKLRWDTESEFYKYRKPKVSRGDIILIKGTFWGISEGGDVIIDVKEMKVVKKGGLIL